MSNRMEKILSLLETEKNPYNIRILTLALEYEKEMLEAK